MASSRYRRPIHRIKARKRVQIVVEGLVEGWGCRRRNWNERMWRTEGVDFVTFERAFWTRLRSVFSVRNPKDPVVGTGGVLVTYSQDLNVKQGKCVKSKGTCWVVYVVGKPLILYKLDMQNKKACHIFWSSDARWRPSIFTKDAPLNGKCTQSRKAPNYLEPYASLEPRKSGEANKCGPVTLWACVDPNGPGPAPHT